MDSDSSLQTADREAGTLVQRDYWAVLVPPDVAPREVARALARALVERFCEFAPPGLSHFARETEGSGPLQAGGVLTVDIRHSGTYRVRVVHRDELSLTLVTEEGHPEAGRITFGSYPNAAGETVLHIRSRARAGSPVFALGLAVAGQPLQATTWTEFLNRLATMIGRGIRDVIHVETREVEETPDDRRSPNVSPTYRAMDGDEPDG